MPKVVRRENEDLEMLLRRFRRRVNDANILGECRKREFFVSNGEKKKERRLKKKIACRKQLAEDRREERRDFNTIRREAYTEPLTYDKERPAPIQSKPKDTAGKPAFYSYRRSAPKATPDKNNVQ